MKQKWRRAYLRGRTSAARWYPLYKKASRTLGYCVTGQSSASLTRTRPAATEQRPSGNSPRTQAWEIPNESLYPLVSFLSRLKHCKTNELHPTNRGTGTSEPAALCSMFVFYWNTNKLSIFFGASSTLCVIMIGRL